MLNSAFECSNLTSQQSVGFLACATTSQTNLSHSFNHFSPSQINFQAAMFGRAQTTNSSLGRWGESLGRGTLSKSLEASSIPPQLESFVKPHGCLQLQSRLNLSYYAPLRRSYTPRINVVYDL